MNWYYAENGRQVGPIDEAQFESLIQSGRITPETLVWREGMANWLPLREAKPSPAAATPITPGESPMPSGGVATSAPAPEGHVTCVECRQTLPQEQCIQYGTTWVCATCKPIFIQRLQEGAASAGLVGGALDFGGFWIRAGAKILDGLIIGAVIMIPTMLLLVLGGGFNLNAPAGNQPPTATFILMQVLIQFGSILAVVAYNTFFIARYAATPGKMVCGLKVVMSDGSPVTGWRAFGRAWADQLSAMICYIGYIIAAFDEEKRALHDHICSTRVVRK